MQDGQNKPNIVLLGIGHTNAQVVQRWQRKPLDANLICISDFPFATYSGMLPGVLSQQYDPRQMQINLQPLCDASGAELIVDRVTSIDVQNKQLSFESRDAISYDFLSIGIGSQPSFQGVDVTGSTNVIPVKPMQTLVDRLQEKLQPDRDQELETAKKRIIDIVGAGIGGLEIAMCLARRFQLMSASSSVDSRFEIRVISGTTLAKGLPDRVARELAAELERRGIRVVSEGHVSRIDQQGLVFQSGQRLDSDAIVWITSAQASPILRSVELPKDERGFILTNQSLQSIADSSVFAVGDSGTLESAATDKAGVFAVRQGPILFANLQRILAGKPLKQFRPQRNYLKLINLGDGRAIGEFHGFRFKGRWVWRLKDLIDRSFIKRFQLDR